MMQFEVSQRYLLKDCNKTGIIMKWKHFAWSNVVISLYDSDFAPDKRTRHLKCLARAFPLFIYI